MMANIAIFLPKRRENSDKRVWHGMAFIMEALVLLLFLVISTAVLVQIFGSSRAYDADATALTRAVTLASNEAERFSANPASDVVEYYDVENGVLIPSENAGEDSFTVKRTVEPQQQDAGTLYYATIVVEHYDQVVYELESASYKKSTEGSS